MILEEVNLLHGIRWAGYAQTIWLNRKQFDKTSMTIYMKPVVFKSMKPTVMQTIFFKIR